MHSTDDESRSNWQPYPKTQRVAPRSLASGLPGWDSNTYGQLFEWRLEPQAILAKLSP
jgi:hypothetical protein